MLKGTRVGLRDRREDDIPVLRAELYNDVVNAARAEGRPWRPVTANDPQLAFDNPPENLASFSVVELEGDTLIGTANLWGIDTHNRNAHIGVGLLPRRPRQGLRARTSSRPSATTASPYAACNASRSRPSRTTRA